jgi:predicted phosphodiesterase
MRLSWSWAILVTTLACGQTVVVKPYVQPGNGVDLRRDDTKTIAWLTDATPGDFTVRYGYGPSPDRTVRPRWVSLDLGSNRHYLKYWAELPALRFDALVFYHVSLGERIVRRGAFETRRSVHRPVRFAVVGDIADGRAPSHQVAFQMAEADPQAVLVVGDIVYDSGRVSEYLKRFWPAYSQPEPNRTRSGASLMASVPLYGVLGNHDIYGLRLATNADGLGAFYFFHPPRNGPADLAGDGWPNDLPSAPTNLFAHLPFTGFTPVAAAPEKTAAFMAAANTAYPALCFYSFDDGPVHFLCLDANRYTNLDGPALQRWIAADLARSRAPWKLVFLHQAPFHASTDHAKEQRARRLAPLFERGGVDVVFAGHVHNYQRSKPIRYRPEPLKPGGQVPGQMLVDDTFDGLSQLHPDGVIYVVTGAGGATLDNKDYTDRPDKWQRDPPGTPRFMARVVSDRHSFTLVDADARQLVLRQIDERGQEFDRCTIARAARPQNGRAQGTEH